ncbi:MULTISPECIES: addiction module antidote protein [Sphingopyxis]|uniref:addiction module antidote protein n=1 Tax=Sphingopyxis TaxID=165697 RepID=UPI001D0B6A6F|nr:MULTISPECIES: addiction module antidote protein [Sphingopyxis]
MPIRDTLRRLTEQPLLRALPVDAAQVVLALRYCILCRRGGRDPMPELERRWGKILAARRFRLVVEAIGHVWPDPFAVAPPCCPHLSFDEALLASVTVAAAHQDRAHFDWLTNEMLGCGAREMLFVALGNFVRAKAPGRVYHRRGAFRTHLSSVASVKPSFPA